MIRIFLGFILICLGLPVSLQAAEAFDPCDAEAVEAYTPIAERYTKGVFFKIESCGEEASYLLGTIHSDAPEIMASVQPAIAVLQKPVSTAAFEYVDTAHDPALPVRYMYFDPASTHRLTALIDSQLFAQLSALLKKELNIPAEQSALMRPWAAAVLLEFPAPVADGIVLDEKLKLLAQQHSIALKGLETLEEQFDIFATMPQALQLSMLQDAVAHIESIKAFNVALQKAYLDHDMREIVKLGNDSMETSQDTTLTAYIQEHVVLRRNQSMTDRMMPLLDAGNAFIAVGILHLPEEKGILALLEKRGYFISVID